MSLSDQMRPTTTLRRTRNTKAAETRLRILDMVATDGLFMSGFHLPFPGTGYVEKSQGSYRWVPHSYQLNL